MRGIGLVLLVVTMSALPGAAETDDSFTWDHEGYRSLVDAAVKAKERKAPLLVGLFGGPG